VLAGLPMHHHQRHRNIPERSLTDPPNAPPLPPWLTPTSQNDRKLKKVKMQNRTRLWEPVLSSARNYRLGLADTEYYFDE